MGQHAKRNLIAGSATAIGLFAALFMIGYCTQIASFLGTAAIYIQQPGHIAVLKKGGLRYRLIEPEKYSLSASEVAALERIATSRPEIDILSPYLYGTGLVGSGCKSFPFRAIGISLAQEKRVKNSPELKSVIPEYRASLNGLALWDSKLPSPIGLSLGLAKRLGKSPSSAPQISNSIFNAADCESKSIQAQLAQDPNIQLLSQDYEHRINAVDSNVVNEFSTGVALTENSTLQMDIVQLQDLMRTSKISYLGVFIKDKDQASAIAKDLVNEMSKQGFEIDAYPWDDNLWNPNFVATRNVMIVSQTFISAVVAAVVLLSILNTVNIGLVESRCEIGTLRALGYKPSQVAWIFAIESFCVTIVALSLGAFASFALFRWIKSMAIPLKYPGLSQASTFQIVPPLWSYLGASVLLCLMIVMTTLIIARRYASQPTLTLLDRGS